MSQTSRGRSLAVVVVVVEEEQEKRETWHPPRLQQQQRASIKPAEAAAAATSISRCLSHAAVQMHSTAITNDSRVDSSCHTPPSSPVVRQVLRCPALHCAVGRPVLSSLFQSVGQILRIADQPAGRPPQRKSSETQAGTRLGHVA